MSIRAAAPRLPARARAAGAHAKVVGRTLSGRRHRCAARRTAGAASHNAQGCLGRSWSISDQLSLAQPTSFSRIALLLVGSESLCRGQTRVTTRSTSSRSATFRSTTGRTDRTTQPGQEVPGMRLRLLLAAMVVAAALGCCESAATDQAGVSAAATFKSRCGVVELNLTVAIDSGCRP